VSFRRAPGEVFTLIGPNGAGKTTVFNLISRCTPPTSGEIFFEGHNAHADTAAPDRLAGHRAHLPEHRAVRTRLGAAEPADRAAHPPSTGLWSEMFFTRKRP
jgi:branched-chain amino acid transport system ATP-binding protein